MSPSTTTPALPDTSLTAGRGAAPKRPTVPDVVAGLVNGGSAYAVARAAVEAAVARGARVRFVQVPPPGLDVEERHDADRTTFREALRAMHGLPKVACSFELVDGAPGCSWSATTSRGPGTTWPPGASSRPAATC
jgi:hypothetical protein